MVGIIHLIQNEAQRCKTVNTEKPPERNHQDSQPGDGRPISGDGGSCGFESCNGHDCDANGVYPVCSGVTHADTACKTDDGHDVTDTSPARDSNSDSARAPYMQNDAHGHRKNTE